MFTLSVSPAEEMTKIHSLEDNHMAGVVVLEAKHRIRVFLRKHGPTKPVCTLALEQYKTHRAQNLELPPVKWVFSAVKPVSKATKLTNTPQITHFVTMVSRKKNTTAAAEPAAVEATTAEPAAGESTPLESTAGSQQEQPPVVVKNPCKGHYASKSSWKQLLDFTTGIDTRTGDNLYTLSVDQYYRVIGHYADCDGFANTPTGNYIHSCLWIATNIARTMKGRSHRIEKALSTVAWLEEFLCNDMAAVSKA